MNKMKNKKISQSSKKIDTTNTQIRDCLFSCLSTLQ